jgi:hypothetical protein
MVIHWDDVPCKRHWWQWRRKRADARFRAAAQTLADDWWKATGYYDVRAAWHYYVLYGEWPT